jgi:hypothetical protein
MVPKIPRIIIGHILKVKNVYEPFDNIYSPSIIGSYYFSDHETIPRDTH